MRCSPKRHELEATQQCMTAAMWFGVAPAPAPSPRTNTKAWHPPHCTCAKHRGLPKLPVASPRSSHAHSPHQRPHTLSPLSASHETCAQLASSPRQRHHVINNSTHHFETTRRLRHHARDRVDMVPPLGTGSSPSGVPAPITIESKRTPSRLLSNKESSNRVHESLDEPERSGTQWTMEDGDNNSDTSTVSTFWRYAQSNSRHASRRERSLDELVDAHMNAFEPDMAPRVAVQTPVEESQDTMVAPKSRRGSRARVRSRSRSREAMFAASTGGIDSQPPTRARTGHRVSLTAPITERANPTNLVGHTSSVSMVLVENDCYIVSASIDGSVKIWLRTTFECIKTLYGHDDTVSCVDVSNRWLVSGSHDTTLRVYDSEREFRFVHSLEGHRGHVTRVLLLSKGASDRPLALSCSDDATLRLWDLRVGTSIMEFKSHNSRVTCLLVLPHDASSFCSGSADASICFWDASRAHSAVACDPHVVDPPRCSSFKSHRVHKTTVQCLLARSRGSSSSSAADSDDTVFSCSNDGTIQWFSARSWLHLGCIDSVKSPIYSMAFHASFQYLVCSTGDGRLLVYSDWASLSSVSKKEFAVAPTWISSLQLLHGHLLACASEENLYIVNLARARIDRVIATAHGFINCVRWLQPEKIATSGEDNIIKVWSIL